MATFDRVTSHTAAPLSTLPAEWYHQQVTLYNICSLAKHWTHHPRSAKRRCVSIGWVFFFKLSDSSRKVR